MSAQRAYLRVPATHLVWDDWCDREVSVCIDCANLIDNGKGGRRFDGNRPRLMAPGEEFTSGLRPNRRRCVFTGRHPKP